MNPYWAGFGLGLVLLTAFVVMGRGLGASGAFTTAVATTVHAVAPAHATGNAFYAEYLGDGTTSPLKDWLVFEVLGVFVDHRTPAEFATSLVTLASHGSVWTLDLGLTW